MSQHGKLNIELIAPYSNESLLMRILNPKTVIRFLSDVKEEKVGYLYKKRSEQKKNYKKRYFVLSGNILAYYEKKTDKEPLGIIFLEFHVVEMLSDVKVALRFRGPGETFRSYILKSESSDDMEDWMRALSRCGIDFFKFTLEDLEDQLKALSTVQHSSVSLSPITSPSHENKSFETTAQKRPNPFNSSTIKSDSESPVSSNLPTNTKSSSNDSQTSPKQHLRWLFSQNWEQLHHSLLVQFKCDMSSKSNLTSDRQT